MARIRIIDEWLRSPVSSPSRHRAVMVVAESWSEQRVLMRAFAASRDQTRPTIMLHGHELAIGPAGTDPHGEWGIHVEPPVDGRAQELRSQLEVAARRLAGSKGNPPRLVDEGSRFDGKATNLWAPGTPADPPRAAAAPPRPARTAFGYDYYEPAVVAPPIESPVIPSAASQPALLSAVAAPAGAPAHRLTEQHWAGRARRPSSPPGRAVGARTEPGYLPAAAARPTFASLVGRTMPIGLHLTDLERDVLNSLGRAPRLSATEVGRLTGAADPVAWMEQLMTKLIGLGLDLVSPGEAEDGEPTYALRR